MTSLENPYPVFTFRWWIHEAAICEEDGHPGAARAAYTQAAEAADNKVDLLRALAMKAGI